MADVTTFKLGRRPPIPGRKAIRFEDIWTGKLPALPAAVDHFGEIAPWILGKNDKFGVCGPVSAANKILLGTTHLTDQPVRVSQEAIFDLYRRSGNPRFNPNLPSDDPRQQDDGVVLQTMYEELLRGGIGGIKAVAFAKVDARNFEHIWAAMWIFGSITNGVLLREAQKAQTDQGVWDYKPSLLWGGHAVEDGVYRDESGTVSDEESAITWALKVRMTYAFMVHQREEVWVVVFPWNLKSKQFKEGVKLDELASIFHTITDGKVLPIEPTPNPVPDVPSEFNWQALVFAVWQFIKRIWNWLRSRVGGSG